MNKIVWLVILGSFSATNFLPAQTWIQTGAPSNSWQSVACSADGKRLVAVAATYGGNQINGTQPGPIYSSTDSGATWTQISATNDMWNSVASSANGTKLAATAGFDGVYVSTNSGSTWFWAALPTHQCFWSSVAFSADGTKLAASANNGGIYTSTNSGATWIETGAPASTTNYWPAVASSADGCKLVAVSAQEDSGVLVGGPIYISTNYGTTWVQTSAPNELWFSAASSADGTRLAAVASHGSIYISTNSGTDWIQANTSFGLWGNVVLSADGTKLAAGRTGSPLPGDTNQVFASSDSGATWNPIGVPNTNGPMFIASTSADGNELIAVSGGYIYLWQSTPSPQLNIAAANNDLLLSWLVPSTNFVLQLSSDLSSWTDLTNTPALNPANLHDEVALPFVGTSSFYRLKTP